MKKTFKFLTCLFVAILCFGQMWATDFTVNSSTSSSDALFSVAETMTNYTYSGYWEASQKLITFATGSSITVTNVTGATITAITAEGVADNNANKTVCFTASDGTTSAAGSSSSWNNRKSSSMTTGVAFDSENVNKFKCDAGQTYTFTNNSSSSYKVGAHIVITYTSTLPTSLTNGATTSSTQALSWTAPSTAPANGYLVAYSTSSTTPGNSVTSTSGDYTVAAIAAGTTSASLSELSASTTYYWWVRSKNARGNSSWVAGSSFTTESAGGGGDATTYTISLDANGGSVASYEGWTKEGDVYSKTVEEGTSVSLLAFTKTDVQLMFFRDGSANEYTSPVTLNADLDLKAVWGEEKEVEIYYWEGKSGGADEEGGTIVTKNDGTTVGENDDINVSNGGYYTLRFNGASDFGGGKNYLQLTTDVNVKTGDKVKFTGFCNKGDKSKKAGVKMATYDGTTIFAESDQLPDIGLAEPETPAERTYTVPEGIDTKVFKLSRSLTNTNAFVSRFEITGTRLVEVLEPAATPTISAQPVGASYTVEDEVSALTVTASVTDGGTLHYQWYKVGETDTKVGSDAASYTPTESGTYYVVVTNKKTGYSDNSTTSNNAVVTIEEIPTLSDDATLKDLKIGGVTVAGFNSSKNQYYVELPYGTAHADFPVVTVTTNEEHATAVVNDAKDREDDITVVHVTAQNGVAEKYYNVYFSVAPKLGVEVFAYTPVGSNGFKDATGYKGGKADINLQTSKTEGGYKLGSVGHYIGIAVTDGLKANDVICIDIAHLQGASALTFFDGKKSNKTQVITPAPTPKVGKNYVTVPSDMDSIYLYRVDGTCNPSVKSVAVYREMSSFFESFTVAGVTATIDETVSPKTITVEVPAVTDITSLTPTYKAWANGGATVSPTTAQNFSAGAIDYTVTSAYGETTTYKVTVTKAASIKEVVISGTLSVKENESTTLSAAVYDTNDALAAIQNVTWSVKSGDEALAEISSAGVVTGKAAGTAHIIATSVADDSKSAEVAVTVTENPCRTWNAPASTFDDATLTIGKLQIVRGACSASSVQPYKDASNVYGIKITADSRFITLSMSDHSQFESLTLGAASNSNGSSPKYVVVASSAEAFGEGDVLSVTEYVANAKDAIQALNEIDLPTGTRYVRVYRKYDDKGDGTSVFLYHVAACKKEFVALTSVAVADKNLAVGVAGVPAITLTPANADVTSYAWEIVSDATGVATIDATTGAVSGTATGLVTVKVTVTDALSNAIVSNIATITIVNKYVTVVPVSATQTWDWAPVSVTDNGPIISASDTVLANYLSGDEWKMLAGANGDWTYRSSTYKAYQGVKLSFKAAVPGILKIYAGRLSNDKKVYVNGHEVGTVTSTKAYLNKIVVPAGDVVITSESMRIYSMTFDTDLSAYTLEDNVLGGYDRTVNAGNYGTICLPNGGVMAGASIFEIAYFDNAQRKIFFDEVVDGHMVAGRPHIFLPNEGETELKVYYTDNANATAGDYRGLYGFFDTSDDNAYQKLAENDYFLYNNQYYVVDHAAVGLVAVGNYRAYIKLSDVDGYPSEPAPGRRRVSMNVNGKQVATDLENVSNANAPRKVLINGRMFIMIGEKMYDVTGQIVK